MTALDARRERRLLEQIERIHRARDLDVLAMAMVEATEAVIPAEQIAYNELDSVNRRLLVLGNDEVILNATHKFADVLDRYFVAQHPVARYFAEAPGAAPTAISDVMDLTVFHELELYREFYRHLGMTDQLSFHVGTLADGYAAIALNRQGGFSAEDRLAAARLQAAFRFAYRGLWLEQSLYALTTARAPDRLIRLLRGLGLTPRQADVAVWLLQGKSNPEIGEILAISPGTVKRHAAAIYEQLGVSGRAGLQQLLITWILRRSNGA